MRRKADNREPAGNQKPDAIIPINQKPDWKKTDKYKRRKAREFKYHNRYIHKMVRLKLYTAKYALLGKYTASCLWKFFLYY